MKKLYVFIGLIVIYSFLAVAMNNKIAREKIEGKWNVKIIDAPYGYQDYVFDIKVENNEYKVDILYVDSKQEVFDRTFHQKNKRLCGHINIDNERRIDISIWEEKGVVQGMAQCHSFGTLEMILTHFEE